MNRAITLWAIVLLLTPQGFAKGKSKVLLPPYILHAKTVAVVIDPEAGVSLSDPEANQVARKDVETALANWGRFDLVMNAASADLVIVVRRGNGKLVNATVTNPRQNDRGADIDPTDTGVVVGAQHGRPPGARSQADDDSPLGSPHPQTEVGNVNDSFIVYEGNREDLYEAPAGWIYTAKDGLRPHTVPAVEAFRKRLVEAEKAAAKP